MFVKRWGHSLLEICSFAFNVITNSLISDIERTPCPVERLYSILSITS